MSGTLSMFGIEEETGKDLNISKDLDLRCVDTTEKIAEAFKILEDFKGPIALDTETEGLSFKYHHIVGLILATSTKQSFYFPIRHKIGDNCEEADIIVRFKHLAETHKFILFNAKFDWEMIKWWWHIDFDIEADAQIMAYLVDSDLAESKNLSLKSLTKDIFGYQPLELSKDFGTTNFSLLDPLEAYKYAAPDGTNTYELYNYYKPKMKEYHLEKAFRIEHDIIKAVATIEMNGIYVDSEVLLSQQDAMQKQVDSYEEEIYRLAGHEFDVNSSQQMATVFYDELGLPKMVVRGEESRSVGKEALQFLAGKHPIIQAVQNYRDTIKLLNDFVIKLPEAVCDDNRIYGGLNSTGTRSGRLSASGGFGKGGEKIKVNLQQLPKAKKFYLEKEIEIPDNSELDASKTYYKEDLVKLGILK